MAWLLGGLAILFLLDAVRLRGRLAELVVLEASDEPVAEQHRFIVASGVVLDAATRRAASAYARENELEVVDLIPGDNHVSASIGLLQLVAPSTYRRERFAMGRSAGYALLATRNVLARSRTGTESPADPVAVQRVAARLKRFACRTTDFAVAPRLRAHTVNPNRRRAVVRFMLGEFYLFPLVLPLVNVAIIAFGALFAPLAAALALASYHLATVMLFVGTGLTPRDRWRFGLLRLPLETWTTFALLCDRWQPVGVEAAIEEGRARYDELLDLGWERFFEPRSESCPLCGDCYLEELFTTRDNFQQKPGRFTLERCVTCGHIFQNPRLTAEGLSFYYRDYYDGLGAELTERVFSSYGDVYARRARMVGEVVEQPARWLDVGCGHGHFCCAARDELKGVEYHGLDLSESVEEAYRRGWIDKPLRGLFPELAPELANSYDVVSMHHYLEHVLDPAAEIEAARTALVPGGYLLVEVPAPESRLGRMLGRFWVNWLQPQHLHFVSMRNMDRLLRDHGFTPVSWQGREAHMPIDISWAVILLLQRLAPTVDRPWKPPATICARTRRAVVWTLGSPLVGLASLVDRALARFVGPLRSWNLYRVLARLDLVIEIGRGDALAPTSICDQEIEPADTLDELEERKAA
jgi:SAM-dependent methyltransferase